ncbi:ABC transporter permease [Candidatus Bathyarchaeota archaeon]|nr:ABC transporter permease [Candidatus Bathyarchaeota archaeon]
MFTYAFKRVTRSWKLFAALLLGVALASTFFAGINMGADTTARQALDQQLSQIFVDMTLNYYGGYIFERSSFGGISTSQLEASSFLSSTNLTEASNLVSNVPGVTSTEIISRLWATSQIVDENTTYHLSISGIQESSKIYEGLTVLSGIDSLGVNETFIEAGSKNAGNFEIGNIITFNITFGVFNDTYQEFIIPINLTVTGFVSLSDEALSIATGNYYGPSSIIGVTPDIGASSNEYNLLITSWDETVSGILDTLYELSIPYSPISTEILTYMDRESLINPWDISGSLTKIQAITSQIENKVLNYGLYASNRLQNVLNQYQYTANTIMFTSLFTALPVFFMAWYMATTVSGVSLNLRRREIGLLMAKGVSGGQLLKMFLSEAILIGLIGGAFGIGLSIILTPLFVNTPNGGFNGFPTVKPETILLTIVFSVAITLIAIFQPARRASKLKAVDALREYIYVEDVKPYRKALPWIAFILGALKIIIFILGINIQKVLTNFPPGGGGLLIQIILGILMFLDNVLNYVGPLLFFWGFTKIFIRGSLKFQEVTTRIAKGFLGDLDLVATRNVRRNPARTASIAFLIALIIGYSVSVAGALASEEDYTLREIYFNVGSDISVTLDSTENASTVVGEIESLSGVSSTSMEYSFYTTSTMSSIRLKAVDPENWITTAYYEEEWFSGNEARTAFQSMFVDHDTIILERNVAEYLDLSIGDTITLTVEGEETEIYNLKILAYFGSTFSEDSYLPGPLPLQETSVLPPYFRRYWSYVSKDLYNNLSNGVYASAKILIKLNLEANGTDVAEEIRDLGSDINWVYSVAEQLENYRGNAVLNASMNIQRLGTVFAIAAASIGTALVALVNLRERRREISIMNVRGLSYRQLVVVLLTESLATVLFAVLLGIAVGLIIVRGNVASTNALAYSLVMRRVVFPLESLLTLGISFFLVFASIIVPVAIITRSYTHKIERLVRQS